MAFNSNVASIMGFWTVLELIHGSLVGSSSYPIISHDNANRNQESTADSQANPEIAGIVERLAQCKGKMIDKKQNSTIMTVQV